MARRRHQLALHEHITRRQMLLPVTPVTFPTIIAQLKWGALNFTEGW
jgi:hypothetical protein